MAYIVKGECLFTYVALFESNRLTDALLGKIYDTDRAHADYSWGQITQNSEDHYAVFCVVIVILSFTIPFMEWDATTTDNLDKPFDSYRVPLSRKREWLFSGVTPWLKSKLYLLYWTETKTPFSSS